MGDIQGVTLSKPFVTPMMQSLTWVSPQFGLRSGIADLSLSPILSMLRFASKRWGFVPFRRFAVFSKNHFTNCANSA